jgi:hypothetical protein
MCFKVIVMRRFFAVLACLVTGLAVSGVARGVEVPGLYEAEVPVTGQSAVERAAASRSALERVLVKVSGNADIAQLPKIEPLLSNAEKLVQRYQYRTAPSPAPGTEDADTSTAPGQLLWESFDRRTINQHLYDAGVSVWGINRPATLLWLAIEDGRHRYLVGGDNRPDVQTMLSTEAQQRGLPLNVPLLDLQDQGALAVADVWGDFSDVIFKASSRYQPDAILVGRVYATAAGKWQSQWTLYDHGKVSTWGAGPAAQDAVISAGIAGAAGQFAKRYALELTPGVANTVMLSVENVATLADYARVERYLQSLDPVADVQVARVEGPKVGFRIKLRGPTRGLIQTLVLGKTLVAATPQQSGATTIVSAPDQGAEGGEPSPPEEYFYRIAP